MRVDGVSYRSIWLEPDGWSVGVIDQTKLPHAFTTLRLTHLDEAAHAIRSMQVRGAPLIGAVAAYGLALALRVDASDGALATSCTMLSATRPTAVNLRWAIERMRAVLAPLGPQARAAAAYDEAAKICNEDVAINEAIGRHGLAIIEARANEKRGKTVNLLTHCNAGWLATVDWGTALAPMYMAHDAGIDLHVWVDETRPRNQGAGLTAWELGKHGVKHTVIVDNAGGHLMQHGQVDLCIVGTDRVTARGDVANKIGTYLKALAAYDNAVPFYVALPSTTIDWSIEDGVRDIPIEERAEAEVLTIAGQDEAGRLVNVAVTPKGARAANFGFDVTPARLVTGLITERGVCAASKAGLSNLFPNRDHGRA